jgi:hypothetical protein
MSACLQFLSIVFCLQPNQANMQNVLPTYLRRHLELIKLKKLVFVSITLLAFSFTSNVEALSPALEIELPSVQGWQIEAIKRGDSVMCSARKKEENSVSMTLLADTKKYRGGVWFLEIVSRNQHLKLGTEYAVADLSLDDKPVVKGRVSAVADWVGDKTTATYVRFEFPAIDAYIKDIKAARIVEAKTDGLSSLKIEGLPTVIFAVEKCQQESLNLKFWKNAKEVCN